MNKFPENISLKTCEGGEFNLSEFAVRNDCVIVIYPKMGQSGKTLPCELNSRAGMTGCTPQNLAYAALAGEFAALGYEVIAVGTHESLAAQAEFKASVGAPYTFLNDDGFALRAALNLPTFRAGDGREFYFRRTIIVKNGAIIANYEVSEPENDAANALNFVRDYREGHF